jgi:hypothetical protein
MRGSVILFLLFIGAQALEPGFLAVQTDRPGLSIFLDGEFIGASPIASRPVVPGEHTVSLFHPDTIENAYWQIRQFGIPGMVTRLPGLRRFDVGTKRIVVNPNATVKVFLSSARAQQAPSQTCCLMGGSCIGIVGGSFVLGFILAWLLHQ